MNAIIGKLKDKPSLVTLLIILLIAVQIIDNARFFAHFRIPALT